MKSRVCLLLALASCDFGGAFERYCDETGRCDGGIGPAGGGTAGGATAGGTAGGMTAGGAAGGMTAGGAAGGTTAGGVAGGMTAGGAAGGMTAGGAAGGMTAGGVAGGMTAGGAAGGMTAGGGALEPDDLFWPDGGWRQDLKTLPDCIVVPLQARLGGQPFVFATPTPPRLELLLENGALAPGADGGPSVSLGTSCSNASPPQFAADASVVHVAVRSRRVGVYRIQASLGPLQKTSETLTAAPYGWAAFPEDGGGLLRFDGGTACVEMIGRALPWPSGSNPPPQRFLEVGMDVTFNLPATSGWTLTRSCSLRTPASSLTFEQGADALRFGLLISALDAGIFFMELPPAVPQFGLSGGMRFSDLRVENGRLCTQVGTAEANRCSDRSECCTAATQCSPPNGANFLTCQ